MARQLLQRREPPNGQSQSPTEGNPPAGLSHRTALARKFDRNFSDGTQEVRMLREIVFGKKRSRRFWTSEDV